MKSTPLRLGAAVLLLAVALAVFGISQLVMASTPQPSDHEVTVDDLTTKVDTASWTRMEHTAPGQDSSGFQMPDAMMPGAPKGENQRLAVTVTVSNTSAGTRPLEPATEFALRTGKGEPRAPKTHTFSALPRLAPNNAVTGVLFFDLVPAELADSSAWLEWKHGGVTSRLAVPVGKAPDHTH